MQASSLQKGVGDEVDYRGDLHRDGFVLLSVSLDQLKQTHALLYRSLAAKLVVGMPFKARVWLYLVRGDEPYEELNVLEDGYITMLLHITPFSKEKISRVHATRSH